MFWYNLTFLKTNSYRVFSLHEIIVATTKPSFYITNTFQIAFQIITEFCWVSMLMVAKFFYFSRAWIILLKHIQVNLFVLSWREMEKECQAFPLPFQNVFLTNIPLLSSEQTISSQLGASKCLVSSNPTYFLCSSNATEVVVSCIYYFFLPPCSVSAFTDFQTCFTSSLY